MSQTDPIQHIVVLMLENNSFDRMLGCMAAVYPQLEAPSPTEDHVFKNPDYPDQSHEFAQLSGATPSVPIDPAHELDDVLRQIAQGKCSGFVSDFAQHSPKAPQTERYEIMAYFTRGDLPVLHALTENFLICDHWFSSVPGPTWPNRFFVHSGTSLGHVDMPSGFFHPALHLYDQPTVYQRLTEKNIVWRIYYGDVPQSLLMVEQLKFLTNYRRMERFAADVRGPVGDFPQYVFIEPCYFGANQNDQHPPTDVAHGEVLIAQVYNEIRANEELWASTLFVILYDEHGGFYDHVPPPPAIPPDDNTKQFAFDQLGVRVPAILISPWVDPGVLSLKLEHTSLLKYATDKWGLGPLGARVPQSNSFATALTARNNPRSDCLESVSTSSKGAPNDMNVALNSHQVALAGFTHHLEANYTQPPDSVVADHSRAMAADFESQSQVASQRVEQFFAKSGAVATTGRPS
jgi:phospholipase C